MKKRILSLILALSMVLSVLPLGAFAADPNQDLVIGSDGYPVGSEGGSKDCNGGGNGNDWEYYSKSRILCLNGGTFDLSTTEPVKCKISSAATITGGTFNGAVENIDGTISGGIFNGTVTNASTGKISGGTFAGSVENQGTIKNGSFEGQVTNDSNGEISGGTFQSTGSVTNEGTITGKGTFNGTVTNSRYIENGTFNGTVTNSRYIKNGTFNGTVTNNDAIHGGIFAGSVNNSEGCHIYGGVFNGKTGLDGVTVLISITVASGAKITEVNGVSAAWKPYVVVTSFTETREVIITADTEIFSLNGYPIDESPYSSSYPDTTDKKTVKFTELGVLDNEMVLNGAITHGGDLVMENGYPKASIGGKYSCEGKGWTYSEKDISNLTGKLTLKSNSGTYDFSLANPQDTTKTTSADSAVACAVETQSGVEITGGTFAGSVTNKGTIERGTFAGGVTNSGTIKNGTFACSVTNYSNIESKGTFNGTVENHGGTISSGTFKGTVQNWYGTISGGTFHEKVLNSNGEITGGTFAAGLSANHNTVTGGVFNGKTGLTDALHVTVTNGSVDKVNGVVTTGTAWDLYSYAGTTMTITASTEIFSLNGQPIDESNYPNKNDKKTVTFTMPDANVVLSTGELVMKDGFPEASNGGKISCSGNGWKYNHNDGTLYLNDGTCDFSSTHPKNPSVGTKPAPAVQCLISIMNAEITDGSFSTTVYNSSGGTISDGTFHGEVRNAGTISGGTFSATVKIYYGGTIFDGTFNGEVISSGTITSGTFAGSVDNRSGTVTGGAFNGNTALTDARHVTVTNGSLLKVNGVDPRNADGTTGTAWDLYSYKDTTMTITANTEIFSLNGKPIDESNYPNKNDKTTVTFTMPDTNVVLNGAIASGDLVMKGGYPEASNGGTTPCKGNGWTYSKKDTSNPKGKLTLTDGTYDFSYTYPQNSNGAGAEPVACAVETQLRVKITGGTFEGEVINNDLGVISGGTFHEKVSNSNGMITGGTFKSSVTSKGHGRIFGGVFNSKTTPKPATDAYSITLDAAYPNAKITEVNGMSADWDPYVVVTENATTNEVIITADTEIFSLNGQPIGDGNCNSSYGSDRTTVTFTMPDKDVVLNGAITCTDLVMKGGYPEASNEGKISCSGTGWEYIKKSSGSTNTGTLYLMSGSEPFDFNFADPTTKITRTDAAVKCAIESYATISGGIFDGTVTNNAGGEISDGTFKGDVENCGYIEKGTFNGEVTNNTSGTIFGGTFRGQVDNNGKITGGIFAAGLSTTPGTVTGGIFNGNTGLTGAHQVTVTNGSVSTVNDEGPRNADGTWDLYAYAGTTVTITASTEIFSLNGQPIGAGNCNSSYGSDKTTVTFTMPDDDVVLNGTITSTDLVMENGWPKDSNGGKNPCKGDGWEYIPNDPTNGDMLLLTGSNQTGGLFDFSTIGDGSAVECNVFVGKPTAITGGEFNGKVFNNSGILDGTFHGEVDNRAPGRIVNGTFKNSVENNGMIENGTFHDEVKNNGTINDGAFNGKVENNSVINSGTFNGEVVNTTMGRIENGTFNDAVENNGTIENGTFHDAVKNNGIINGGTFNGAVENNGTINGGTFNGAVTNNGTISGNITGSGTLNGEPITKTPEPEPEPEPTTYTVTVIGGTIDGKTSVSAKENDTLTVVLDQNDIPDGMTFDMWSISSDKLSGDINVDYRAEAMTFQMPAEDVTIRAQYRSAEIIEDAAPSPLATAATIAVGGAAAGIVVWQGVSLGVDLYLTSALPQGVPVPTDRRALALLLWETAGKPEVALPTLYGDIPAEEIELQKATRWAVQNGLMDAADKKDASFFDPDHYVTKMDVFGAWLRLKKLLGTT